MNDPLYLLLQKAPHEPMIVGPFVSCSQAAAFAAACGYVDDGTCNIVYGFTPAQAAAWPTPWPDIEAIDAAHNATNDEINKTAAIHHNIFHPEGESPFKVFQLDADHPAAHHGAGWYWVTLCDDGTAAHEPLFGGYTADECYKHVADHKYVGGG